MDEGELSEPGEEPKLEGGEPCEEDPGGGTTELAGDEGFFRGVPKSASFAWPAHTVREQAQMLPKQCRGLIQRSQCCCVSQVLDCIQCGGSSLCNKFDMYCVITSTGLIGGHAIVAQDPDHYFRPGRTHSHPSAGHHVRHYQYAGNWELQCYQHSQFVSSNQV